MKELTEQKEKKGGARHPFLFLFRGMIFLLLFDASFFEIFDPLLICAILIQIFSKKEGVILNFIKSYFRTLWYPEKAISFLFKKYWKILKILILLSALLFLLLIISLLYFLFQSPS